MYVPLKHLADRRDHSFVTRSRHESPRSVEIVVIRSLHCLIWPRSGRVLPPKKPTICNRFLVMNQQKYGTNNHWEANSCGRTLKKCFSCSKKQDPFRALQHDLNLLICSGWDGVPRRRFDDVFGEGIVFFLPVFTWAMTKNLGCSFRVPGRARFSSCSPHRKRRFSGILNIVSQGFGNTCVQGPTLSIRTTGSSVFVFVTAVRHV